MQDMDILVTCFDTVKIFGGWDPRGILWWEQMFSFGTNHILEKFITYQRILIQVWINNLLLNTLIEYDVFCSTPRPVVSYFLAIVLLRIRSYTPTTNIRFSLDITKLGLNCSCYCLMMRSKGLSSPVMVA